MSTKQPSPFPFFQRIVTTPSIEFLKKMVCVAEKEIFIISPWIKQKTLQKLVEQSSPDIKWRVLTRGDLVDFQQEASDLEAFRFMIEHNNFDVRSLNQLHAKVYIIDNSLSLITSANLTVSGMEINPEVGFASENKDEIKDLIKIVKGWFNNQGNHLNQEWLQNIKDQLSELIEDEELDFWPESLFDPEQYSHFDDNENDDTSEGKYRELPLPESWKPLLAKLKEDDDIPSFDFLVLPDITAIFNQFFEYLEAQEDKERLVEIVNQRFVQNHSFEVIGQTYGISRQRVEQIIKKQVKKSDAGKIFTQQLTASLQDMLISIQETSIGLSDAFSNKLFTSQNLSQLELWQFVCSMQKQKLIISNSHVEITDSNQLLLCDEEKLKRLKAIEQFFCSEYQEFMPFIKFCKLGDLENVNLLWFYPQLRLFNKVYLTKNKTIACRKWSIDKRIHAVAWEFANKLDWYTWHFSEMREALYYLFPEKYENTKGRNISARLPDSGYFQYAGSKGFWQLRELGDGYANNKEAIRAVLLAANKPLHYKEIFEILIGNGRRVNEESIYALLDREKEFYCPERGSFSLTTT